MKRLKFAIMTFFFILFISMIYNVKPVLADSNFTFNSTTGTITGFSGSDTDIVIPETIEGTTVKSIGFRAFDKCTGITSVTFPTSLTSIQSQAFNQCTGLINVNFPSNLETIGPGALYQCMDITSINFPSDSKLTSLQYQCFGECRQLMNVTLPSSLESIEMEAFGECNSLAYAYFKGNSPTIGTNIFSYVKPNFVVYYKATNSGFASPNWLDYKCEAIQQLTMDTSNPSNGKTNKAYSYNFTSTGGFGIKYYTVTEGALPAGLALSTDGKLSGTPTSAGTSNFTITVTDNDNAVSSHAFSLIILSNDAALKSLTLSSGTLSPEFTGTETSYTAAVGNEVISITLTPTVNEANAAVTVNGNPASQAVNLNVGDNTITVLVTAQDGTTNTYTIVVTRAASNDAALKSLILSSGTLSPVFTGIETSYTAAVGNEVTSITLTPTASEANAAVTVNGSPVSQAVNLNVGDNTITVLVTAQDGTINTYTITVKRAAPYVPPYIPPYTPTQPTTETRQVPVLVGNGEQQSTAVQATITRITGSDGSKKDTVVLDESTAAATVRKALEIESTTAVIAITDIPGDNADKTEAQIPSASMAQFASNNMSLIIQTGKASLELPAETIKESERQDIKVQVSEEKESSKVEEDKGLILQLVSGAQIITAPLNIEANITGRVKITIPVDSSKLPTSKEELDKFLSSLAVMVHHSDGENVVDKGTIVYDEKGNIVGISVWVDKFSSFILISLPENYFQGRTTVMKDTVDADKKWQIKFTKPADAATVTKNNVYVVDSKGIKVEAEISYGSDNLLKVTPVELYKSGETYYLYITKGVKAKDGTSLVNELRYQFTVK